MTLPASGVISLNDIATELGISNVGINLNQAELRALAGVPSGAISLSDFYGKSAAAVVANFGATLESDRVANPNVSLNFKLSSDGSILVTYVGTLLGSPPANWFAPTTAGVGSSYYVRATLVSGVTPTGLAMNTWTLIGTGQTVTLSRTAYGSSTCSVLLEVSATAGGTVLGSGTVNLTVLSEP